MTNTNAVCLRADVANASVLHAYNTYATSLAQYLVSICSALALASNNPALRWHKQVLSRLCSFALPWQKHLPPSCLALTCHKHVHG